MNRLTPSSRPFPESLEERLSRKQLKHTFRSLSPRQGVDFSSNDYLALSADPVLRSRISSEANADLPAGASASRLLRGNLAIYEETEKDLAAFCDSEAALLSPSGYQCNLGVLSALGGPGDCYFSDELNHASIIDGIRLSGAAKKVYPHFNLEVLEKLLAESTAGVKIIVTESLFSMDGDVAPLRELAALAAQYDALLIVDEAHATGLWGGSGWVQELALREQVFATLHTGGKALGVGGAWVALSARAKEYLVNFSRPFIFSTAPLPLLARSLQLALGRWREVGPQRVSDLYAKIRLFKQELVKSTQTRPVSTDDKSFMSPIIPLIIGENRPCLEIASQLQRQGLDVRAIRPPTVPEGTARLRITLHWSNSEAEIKQLAEGLTGCGAFLKMSVSGTQFELGALR